MSSIREDRQRRWCALAVAAFLLSGSPARAAGDDQQTADALFEQGKALLDSNRVNEACDRLQDSMRLDPAIGTLGMLAWCHERQGKTATAWREYLEVADMAAQAKSVDREKVARKRAGELQHTLSTLRIEVEGSTPGLEVLVGSRPIQPESWGKAQPLDPGAITILARAPGYIPWRTTVEIGSDSSSIVVRVPALELPKPEPVRVVPKPLVRQETHAPSLAPPLVAYGVGAAGLLVGTIYGLRTIARNDESQSHCDADNHCDAAGGALRDEARRSATVSTIGFGVGIAGAVAGTWLVLSTQDNGRKPVKSAVTPLVAPGNVGLAMTARF